MEQEAYKTRRREQVSSARTRVTSGVASKGQAAMAAFVQTTAACDSFTKAIVLISTQCRQVAFLVLLSARRRAFIHLKESCPELR